MWGLGNRNVGFGQPKCGVWATEMWGIYFRRKKLKATEMWGIYFRKSTKATEMWGLGNLYQKVVALLKMK